MIATLCLLETASALLGICWTKRTLRDRNYFFFETGEPAMIFKVVQTVAEIISSYDCERLAETFKLSKQISCECIHDQMHKSILKLRLLEDEKVKIISVTLRELFTRKRI